jgi:hypothetical protein
MTFRFSAPQQPGSFTFGPGGLGVRGDAVAQSGTHGQGILAQDVTLPAEAADEFAYRITTPPPLLTLFRWFDDGGVEAEGPVGLHTGVAEGRKNGVVYGSAPFFVVVGTAVLAGSITVDDAAPSGVLSPAPPAQLSGGVVMEDAQASGNIGGAPPPAPFMPRRAVTLLYSVLDPTALPDLTPKDPDEQLQLVADFAPFVGVTSPAWQLSRLGGDDGTAPLTLVGTSSIVGGRVTQRVAGGASGNTYTVRCTAQGPDGQTLIAFGRLPVRTRA